MATSDKISLKERYILEENKENFFNSLVKNSETYMVMKLNDHINKYGLELPEETEKELKSFLNDRGFTHHEKQKIRFKTLLMKISQSKNDEERATHIQEYKKKFFAGTHDFYRPANIKESGNLKTVGQVELSSTFSESKLQLGDFEYRKQKFFEGSCEKQISKFRSCVLHKFDLKRLLDKHPYCFEYVVNIVKSFSYEPNFAKYLKSYIKEKQKTNKSAQIPDAWYQKMTLSELEQFKKEYPSIVDNKSFITNHFLKTFEINIGQFPSDENDLEKTRSILIQMYNWTKRMKVIYKSFPAQILLSILENGEKLGIYDKEFFLEYLNQPTRVFSFASKSQRNYLNTQVHSNYDSYWQNVHNYQKISQLNSDGTIKNYLRHFFKVQQNYTEFEKFFQPIYLKQIFYETKLKQGENVEKISEIYTETQLEQIKDKKILKFFKTNKSRFEHGEKVKLTLNIKNIPNLTINIFEINPENYYRKNSKEISAKIKLDGLLPAKQINETFTQPPIIEFVKEFEFKEIQERERGIFIIEFIGGGLSSRAMIRKGSLTLVKQQIRSGIVLHIVNEQKKICVKNTSILIDGKLHKPDEEGKVTLPYGERQQTYKAIVTYGDFAELLDVVIPAEEIRFDASLLFNEESIFTGVNSEFLLQPKLFICGKLVPLNVVQNPSVVVRVVNDKGVQNSRNYDNIKLSYHSDLSIQYLIPPKTRNITITLNGKVKNLSQDKLIDVNVSKSITIDKCEHQETYYNSYLKNTSDKGYVVRFLGRNGEPYQGYTIEVTLQSRHTSCQVRDELKTDCNGEIHLGKLSNYTTLTVGFKNYPGSGHCPAKTYEINRDDRANSIPNDFTLANGDELTLPAQSGEGNEIDLLYSLFKYSSNKQQIIGGYNHLIKQEGDMIKIRGLEPGKYSLQYLMNPIRTQTIDIEVLKGSRWEISPKYVIDEEKITKLQSQGNFLTYSNFKFDHNSISADVISYQPDTVKVHLIGLNHHPENFETFVSSQKSFTVLDTVETFTFGTFENTYLSEKNLSDEIKYVLERKRKNTFMGNTLEKPSALLKRHFNKKTTAESEHLEVERDYAQLDGRAERRRVLDRTASRRAANSAGSYRIYQLNTFLKNQGENITNVKLDENGKFIINQEEFEKLKKFNTLMLVIQDSKSSITQVIKNLNKTIETKSITLPESKTANKVYLYERYVAKLKSGEKYIFQDLNTTEMSMIEDRKNLMDMLKLIGGDNFSDWSFLEKWDQMEPEEQLTKYDKFACHEFNLFAYFRCPDFFEMVVKDYIVNKVEKQLIDHFLLDNKHELEKYLTPYHVQNMNLLEKCLLIHTFRNVEGKKEICEKIAHQWADKVDNQFYCLKTYKQKFDSVLTAQKSKEEVAFLAQEMVQTVRVGGAPPMMQQQVMSNLAMTNFAMPQQMMMQQQIAPMSNYNNYSNLRQTSQRLQSRNIPRTLNNRMDMLNVNNNYSYNESLQIEDDIYQDFAYTEESKFNAAPTRTPKIEKFRTMGVTNEYVEKQYSNGKTVSITSESNKFWVDYMQYLIQTRQESQNDANRTPFLTENFIYCTNNLFEQLMAIVLIDLPETKGTHDTDRSDTLSLTAGSNMMIFTKQMKEKGNENLDLDVIISQRFFDPNDRYVIGPDGKSKMFKKINEFLIGKVYGARIAITNSSESEHEVAVITEIPQGSIPVRSMEYSKSTTIKLNPLSTEILEFSFYFPGTGEFTCYPASITKDGFLVASAGELDKLKVVLEQTEKQMNTIKDILAVGNKEDIIEFMKNNSLTNHEIFNFDSIYWLLKEKEFYEQVLSILREKFIFDETVWGFSIYHNDYNTFKEYLDYKFYNNHIGLSGFKIRYLNLDVLSVDYFQFKEYNPLINPRVHDIGPHKHNILNRDFKNTYNDFLSYLVDKRELDSKDWLYLALYFILQDRIDDAIYVYDKIDSTEWIDPNKSVISMDDDISIPTLLKIQFDYLTAYLDLYRDFPKFEKARSICKQYLVYPVFTWRNRFIDLANQIAEFDGEVAIEKMVLEDDQNKNKDKNDKEADESEYISAELLNNSQKIKITCKNIESYNIAYYKIDLEIMFSQDPFLSVGMADYSFVRANYNKIHLIEKTSDYKHEEIQIDDGFVNSNMLIQITSGAITKSLTYFPSSMKAYIIENYGQIKITDEDNKPLSKVYVKCFQKKKDGVVSFYKDGYTDLRGTFDYASLNLDGVGNIDKFSLLVVSEEKGAMIKQTPPPSRLSKDENKALDIKSKKWQATHATQLAQAQQHYMASRKSKKMNRYMM